MKQWLLGAAARACQKVLDTDPVALHKLRCTMGQTMLIHITDKQIYIVCEMADHGLSLAMADADSSACTVLRGDVPAWLRCATWRRPGMSPGMVIEGDMGLAQTWQQVMRHINIDWAALLAPMLGDSLSQMFADVGARTATHVRDVAKHRVHDAVDYTQEEVRFLPTYHEVQAFYDDVDQLRDDVARIKARLKRLADANAKEYV